LQLFDKRRRDQRAAESRRASLLILHIFLFGCNSAGEKSSSLPDFQHAIHPASGRDRHPIYGPDEYQNAQPRCRSFWKQRLLYGNNVPERIKIYFLFFKENTLLTMSYCQKADNLLQCR
jgi:hypothetical protein